MKHDHAHTGAAGIGALALTLLVAGCGGSSTPIGPSPIGGNLMPNGLSPDHCRPITLSQNFNGQRISKRFWILFTSVTQFPGNQGPWRVEIRDSVIRFSDGRRNFKIQGPDTAFRLDASNLLRLHFMPATKQMSGGWTMKAPQKTAGNDFLNDIAWRVTHNLPGSIKNVTWEAKFFSRDIQQMHWQWGAAVYTRLNDNYQRLGIKPLDDNHYRPFNSDKAGTPERFKGFVTQGATGGGGSNYTGGLSGTLNVVPCR